MRTSLTIAGKTLSDASPCFVIAEIGNNHNGDLQTAKQLIRVAAECGADAVKFQTFKATDIVSPKIPANAYPGFDVSDQFSRWIDFVTSFELSYDAYPELLREAHAQGLAFISTPASLEAIDFLISLKIDALKVASMDMTNRPFLERLMPAGKPLIVSTGMATMAEIRETAALLKSIPYALLHCVSVYPLPDDKANLRNIEAMRAEFPIPIGFSSHSLGLDIDVAAVVLGARILEKHITLDRKSKRRAEHHMSIEPPEFKEMVRRIRLVESALGGLERSFTPEEQENRRLARRSVIAKRDLPAGHSLTQDDITLLRPGTGITPADFSRVIGLRLKRPIEAFQPLTWDDVEAATPARA